MEKEASELVYDYYGLTSSELQLIEDTHNFTLPSLQPRISKAYPKLWEPPSLKELHGYAYWLREALFQNYSPPVELKVTVYQGSGKSPLAVTVVELGKGDGCFVDTADLCLQEKLLELESRWPSEFATGIHSLVQMVFAEQTRLILIKPYRVRYWMPSAAICDADRILEDLRLHHTRASR